MIKKTDPHKTRVGIFVVIGTLILLVTLYFIGNRQHLFTKNIELYAVFQNVNGLQLGNNVRYSGINIGTVSSINMINNTEIVVQMMIDTKTGAFIKKDAIASISSDGLVGSMVINIIPGKENLRAVISADTITSYNKVGTEDMLSTLNVTNKNAALLTSDLLKITTKILKGEGALGALITDSLLTKDIRATLVNLKKTTNGTNKLIGTLNNKFSKINMEQSALGLLVNDTIMGNQVKQIVSNFEQSSTTFLETTKQLEEIISGIKNSENTFNYLTKNETLPKTIDSTMIEIKEASHKLNENMEALKHNFFFRGYFKKQERIEKRNKKIQEKEN
ncbi:phospholipid/cholesterol/gamma-HCH transport system substrate-binding protein [Polaribacter sp. KT25b]|uniref:MlaD family protein n=1 Tax=Polaribacter sp. KT25b TaxID=1855336 RepID=UPI00087CFD5A|nr:MlaD family protein [Polaribacter sp. KT25b]SDR67171.1 phospholipid/cholesterol/gamma-HCH transport system substrate-binding protein [Polaribacter sp. KT25b]